MKTIDKFSRKGFVKSICINDILFGLVVVLLFAWTEYLFIYIDYPNEKIEFVRSVGIFGLTTAVFFIIDILSFVKLDAVTKSLKVWGLYQLCPKTYALSDIAAVHIRYSRRDLFNVILTLKNGQHARLSVGDTEQLCKLLADIAPELKIEKE